MRIGYFGGSFDPPHRGHLAVARAAAAAFQLDTILFVPTGHQPLKPNGPLASYADRLTMVNLLCTSAQQQHLAGPSLVSSTLEAPLQDGAPNYTVDTLTQLKATLIAGDRLFALLGADAFLQLPHWRSPQLLLQLAEWIIVSRPGFDFARLDRLPFSPEQRSHIHLLPTLSDPTTATTLRKQLAQNAPDTTLLQSLPQEVLLYVRQHKLYLK